MNIKPNKKSVVIRQRGFTLVEVMCAAAIAAILFAATYLGIAQGYYIIQAERENLRATQIALSRVEGLRLCNWDTQLTNTIIVPNTFTDYFYPVGLGGFSSNSVIYNGTMTISPNVGFTSSYTNNMRLVTVTVSWADAHDGRTILHTRTNMTYVARYGVQYYIYTH